MAVTRSLGEQIDHVAEQLTAELTGHVDPATVQAEVHRAAEELESARVTQYVPVLVQRTARERLRHREDPSAPTS